MGISKQQDEPGMLLSRCWGAAALIVLLTGSRASAFEFDTGNPDLRVRWDNTLAQSLSFRTMQPSNALINNPAMGAINQDDGNRNFRTRGLNSARTDLLSEFDVLYKNWGVRFSGAYWFDPVYLGKNDNNAPSTVNKPSGSYNTFASATRFWHGNGGELLDAFGFGETMVDGAHLTFRVGRHALLWGETLFYGMNGIAGGQSPLNIIKLQSQPDAQFKEFILPVNQVSGQLQINNAITVGAYYQLQWEPNQFPGTGSYFSTGDFFGPGKGNFFFIPGLIPTLGHMSDQKAADMGQGGLELRLALGGADLGLYAINYHEKTPQLYLFPTSPVFGPCPGGLCAAGGGGYQWVYPENIQAYGASGSISVGDVNLASEVSFRHNMDLASGPQFVTSIPAFGIFGRPGDNNRTPLYATGNTLHANVSALATLEPNVLASESAVTIEVAANRVLGFIKNQDAFDPYATRNALGWRAIYTPTYRQILSGLDISVPVGFSFSPLGKSGAVGPAFGVNHGGDASIGIEGAWEQVWLVGLRYTHFYGPKEAGADASGQVTFGQALADRDFVTFNVRHTF